MFIHDKVLLDSEKFFFLFNKKVLIYFLFLQENIYMSQLRKNLQLDMLDQQR